MFRSPRTGIPEDNKMQISNPSIAIVIVAVVMLSIALAAGLFLFFNKQLHMQKVAYEETILDLQNLIKELEQDLATATDPIRQTIHIPSPYETLPKSCVDEDEGTPVITSLSQYSGSVGDKVTLFGCNFRGYEADTDAWIENEDGVKGFLWGYDENGPTGTSTYITVHLEERLCQRDINYPELPCEKWLNLVPGNYKIFVDPWSKESNKVKFVIQ